MSKGILFGTAFAAALALATPSQAITIELGLAIDGSSSISSTNFELQRDAYISVLQDTSVIARDGSIAIGVYQFSNTAQTEFTATIITDATIGALIASLESMTQLGSLTNIGAAIDLATADIMGNGIVSDRQVIDVSTDGDVTTGGSADTAAANAVAAGVEQVNCLGIGAGADCSFTAGTGSFSFTVADFGDFESTLRTKIGREIGVPEPATLGILGVALAGMGLIRRRRRS